MATFQTADIYEWHPQDIDSGQIPQQKAMECHLETMFVLFKKYILIKRKQVQFYCF